MKRCLSLTLAALCFGCCIAQPGHYQKEANVIYGTVSGAALLMDVYQPASTNGKGILYIPGSAFGFAYPLQYDAPGLKDDVELDSAYTGAWTKALVKKGYTLFVINHRFTPAFQYTDIIGDCKRAVRFIRSNAYKYKIDPNHIGAMGHSSGANLCAMLGTMDDRLESASSKTDSISAKVQAVVALAAPFDLSDYKKPGDTAIDNNFAVSVMSAYVGGLPETKDGLFILSGKYAAASPVAQVSTGDAPMLIYYSDNDPIIPPRQAVAMHEALKKNNVPAKLVEKKGEGHGPVPDMNEADSWFKTYLR